MGGWYLTIDDKPYYPESFARNLHIATEEYIQILTNCKAKKIVRGNIDHYVFTTREDAESAIVAFKLIVK